MARKYLRILQHTLFYKDWATETLACLNDEDRVNAHPEYGRLRRLTPRTDFFFNPDLPEMTLEFLLHANPRNRMAYEYLMACTLLKKDVGRFVHYYPLGADLGYSSVPKGYQEALLFYWLMSKHTATDTIPWKIDPQTENRLREYAQIFTSARSADALSARFGDTYWFYADFR